MTGIIERNTRRKLKDEIYIPSFTVVNGKRQFVQSSFGDPSPAQAGEKATARRYPFLAIEEIRR